MSGTLKLRTTAFGGFQRQDVVDYIEQSAREHAAQLNALRAELKQAQEVSGHPGGEKARADALAQRCEALSSGWTPFPLGEEVESLREQVAEYQPQAQAYQGAQGPAGGHRAGRPHPGRPADPRGGGGGCRPKRAQAQALLDQVMTEYSRVGTSANSAITDVICKLTDLRPPCPISVPCRSRWEVKGP